MFLSVKELELRKLHFDVTFQPGEIPFERGEVVQSSPLHARGSAELLGNTLGEIRVRGHLDVVMEADCDRCLEESRFPIDSDFDEFYRPAETSEPIHGEVALSEGETEVGFYQGDGLELEEVLREFILLALPMQRICRAECRGICPACGQNRNQVDCTCVVQAGSDRWAALRDLKTPGRN